MKHIKGFDGLRAISIILVIITHLGIYNTLAGHPFLIRNYNLFSGVTGVMIFFSISGFLITYLLLNEKRSNGKINFKKFFIRRFLRLFPPLAIFYIAIFFLMYYEFLKPDYDALLISFFYLYNFVSELHYTVELGHTWSLGVEEQFYLLWPFALNYIVKTKNILALVLILILACWIWKMIYPVLALSDPDLIYLSKHYSLDRWFIPASLPIMVGALTALVLFRKETALKNILVNSNFALLLSLLTFFSQLLIPNLPVQLITILQPLGVCIFLLWIYFNQDSFLVRSLEFKPFSFLGKISYGVYVYQGLFLRTGPNGEQKLPIQQFPLNLILVFITAILSYFLIEKRIIKYKERFKIKTPTDPIGEVVLTGK